MSGSARARLAIDIGGTFTDVVLIAGDGRVWERKVSTTPRDYTEAVVRGVEAVLADAGVGVAAVSDVVHATTIGTNTILQRTGPDIGLITTEGFRDVLEIARIRTPTLYDLTWEKPAPLVARRHRLEVRERMSARGEVLEPLDPDSVRRAARRLLEDGVRSVAVTLINSYADPEHEREVGRLLESEFPELSVTLSADVLPEMKEYERTSTTVVNAYLKPVLHDYFEHLRSRLSERGLDAPLQVLRADGGTMSAAAAAELPVHVVASGPSAGVIAARAFARESETEDLIAFDMGGTTAKASVIEGGQFTRLAEYEVREGISTPSRFIKAGGYLLMVPAIDLAEVGNGAGSIARVDAAGGLRVGPESAGADPGPACYGRGGTQPTITDANVALGFLNPTALLGGDLPISRALAEDSIGGLARRLDLEPADAAHGIYAIANSNMIRAIRAVTVERGRDPRTFTLWAFGGSGPVHAVAIARELDIGRVVVPPLAGLFSSFGLLFSDVEHTFSQAWLTPVRELVEGDLDRRFAALERRALRAMGEEGYAERAVALERLVDLRYAGQSAVLSIPSSADEAPGGVEGLEAAFGREHARTYGTRLAPEPVEVVALRVIARAESASSPRSARPVLRPAGAPSSRPVYFGRAAGWLTAPVFGRGDLAGVPRPGPLIVEEYDCTTVVPSGARASLDGHQNIVIEAG